MQLLIFQIRMLRDRIDDQRIVPTPEERGGLLWLGNEINHDAADVMLVVKPQTYRLWLSPKAKARSPKPAGRPGTAEDIVVLIPRMTTENLSWGYKRIFGELKKLGISIGLTTIRDILKRSDCPPPRMNDTGCQNKQGALGHVMIECLKNIIREYQNLEPPEGLLPRRVAIGSLPGKVSVVTGVRGSGKSTLLRQRVYQLIESGVAREGILYLNLADNRLYWLRHENPDLIMEAFFELYPQKRGSETVHCIFDEVQALPGWCGFR
jgi:hypothetical protein